MPLSPALLKAEPELLLIFVSRAAGVTFLVTAADAHFISVNSAALIPFAASV